MGNSLAVQFSSFGYLPAVIHLDRNVPMAVMQLSQIRRYKVAIQNSAIDRQLGSATAAPNRKILPSRAHN
jgi:hypothetical protein